MQLNPLTWFRRAGEASEEKASSAGFVVSSWHTGKPVWTSRNYEKLADEAYVRNAVANRCISLVAGGAAEVMGALILYGRSGEEIDAHDLLELLSRPSPTMGRMEFFEALFSFLLISGNAYVEGVGPKAGPPKELWNQRPDRMTVIAGPYGLPSGFEYSNGGQKRRWQVDPLTGAGPIMHVKEFHPTNDWYGLSRVEPAAYAIDRHNAASAHNKALLDNGARPSGALIFQPVKGASGEGETSAPPEVVKSAEEALKRRHGGPESAGKPFVFGGNVNWLEMGVTPKDMDFGESKLDAARDICEAFRVPHTLIVPGQSTYNNVREAKLALYEEAVIPIAKRVVTALNAWLAPKFGDGLRLDVDEDEVSALEPRREARRKTAVELLEKGLIDDEEARAMLKYGPRSPTAVKSFDAQRLTALVGAVETVGIVPLGRYMRSVGLVPMDMSDEVILNAALDLLEGDDARDALMLPKPGEGDDDNGGPDGS